MAGTTARWRPEHGVEIIAGTPPGGGLDRTARAIARSFESQRLLDVPVEVLNIPGEGARKAWSYVERRAGDPHVLAISSPNLTTDRLVGLTTFDHSAFTPLAILYNEYIAFVVRSDSAIRDAGDLLDAFAERGASLTVALSTALGNPNHIALAKVIRHAGGDVRAPAIRVFDSALDAVADVLAGNAALAAVTAASAVEAIAGGTARAVAVSAPQRLGGVYKSTPAWRELGADCAVGAWRGVTGPRGVDGAAIAFWQSVLRTATTGSGWNAELARHYWTPLYIHGLALGRHLAAENAEMAAIVAELGLVRR
jgi:putative tricarboxylic transport membrane protein